jgi:hypothetical protein
MALSTDEAIAFGFVKTESPKPQETPPQPKSLAEQIYPHLIPNQKGPKR